MFTVLVLSSSEGNLPAEVYNVSCTATALLKKSLV